jgi:hypothetical protein
VLSEPGIKIAPSIYHAQAKTPITLAELAEAYFPKISPARDIYLSVRSEADSSKAEQAPRDEATYREIGRFLTQGLNSNALCRNYYLSASTSRWSP